jgi:uncharacterized Zn finger protein (UPF0148 family)
MKSSKSSTVSTKRKCNYEKKQTTLDACHQQQLDSFVNKWKLTQEGGGDATTNDINGDQLNEEEIEYYTKTADILFNYYDSIEHQDRIVPTKYVEKASSKGKSIMDFFGSSPPVTSTVIHESSSSSSASASASASALKTAAAIVEPKPTPHLNKAFLYDRYLSATDDDYVKDIDDVDPSLCEYCNSNDQTVLLHDGMIYCNDCYTMQYIIVDNDKPSYKEPQKEISYLNYKRKNHFNEWLNQIQGKETTVIPEEIYDSIIMEIKKLKISNMADISHAKIREILKKLRLNKYYEHTPFIYNRITNIPNQYLSPELEDKLRNMFEQIQVPFLKHAPVSRKNFLSYSYCIHKMLQLLGEDQYLSFFPLLKNREKLHQQEQIWKKICEELQWMFIRSI